MEHYNIDIAIIGAGPAGLAAAIQLKRYGIQPLIFERARWGDYCSMPTWLKTIQGFILVGYNSYLYSVLFPLH
jgi:thioredoxin reductase